MQKNLARWSDFLTDPAQSSLTNGIQLVGSRNTAVGTTWLVSVGEECGCVLLTSGRYGRRMDEDRGKGISIRRKTSGESWYRLGRFRRGRWFIGQFGE